MCKFEHKCFLNTVEFLVDFVFDFPVFSIQKTGFFFSFAQRCMVSSNTLSNSFRL